MNKTILPYSLQTRFAQLEQKLNQINVFYILFLCLLLATFSILYHQGGIANPEIEIRLPYYLSDKPLLNKLYDSKTLDLYRARELSYLLDYFDSEFISLSVSLGFPHFLSLTHYVFAYLISFILWHFMTYDQKLKPWVSAGIILLLWTSPAFFLGGTFFRSAKIGTALTTVLLYLLIYRALHNACTNPNQSLPTSAWLACFGLSLSATLLDEEGLFMTGIAIVFILIWLGSFPSKSAMRLLSAFFASLVIDLLYRYLAAPYLTLFLNHYWPNFSAQQLPWQEFFKNPLFYISAGVALWADTVRFLFGDIPLPLLAIILVVAAVIIFYKVFRKDGVEQSKIKTVLAVMIGLITSNVILICVMNSIMFLDHGPLVWPDVRLTYYWLPAVSLHCMTLATVIPWLLKEKFISPMLLFCTLVIAIAGNVFAIPQHQAVMLQGHMKSYFESSPSLLDALRNIKNAGYSVSLNVRQDAIYRFYRSALTSQ